MTRPDLDQTQIIDQPSETEPALRIRRYSADATGNLVEYVDEDGTILNAVDKDGDANGGSQPANLKLPVKAAATEDIALSGLLVVDGYQTIAGDRVLAWVQDDATENGIYVAAEGAWARATDSLTVDSMAYSLVMSEFVGNYSYSTLFLESGLTLPASATFVAISNPAYPWFTALDPANVVGSLQVWAQALVGGVSVRPDPYPWQIHKVDGSERLGAISAPVDGTILTEQRAQWFDATTGAPVVRFKQKDAAGTLTAGVSLSSPGSQTTVGSAGGASALPATPTKFIKVTDADGNHYVIPAYDVS